MLSRVHAIYLDHHMVFDACVQILVGCYACCLVGQAAIGTGTCAFSQYPAPPFTNFNCVFALPRVQPVPLAAQISIAAMTATIWSRLLPTHANPWQEIHLSRCDAWVRLPFLTTSRPLQQVTLFALLFARTVAIENGFGRAYLVCYFYFHAANAPALALQDHCFI